jgi:hypothetical protein
VLDYKAARSSQLSPRTATIENQICGGKQGIIAGHVASPTHHAARSPPHTLASSKAFARDGLVDWLTLMRETAGKWFGGVSAAAPHRRLRRTLTQDAAAARIKISRHKEGKMMRVPLRVAAGARWRTDCRRRVDFEAATDLDMGVGNNLMTVGRVQKFAAHRRRRSGWPGGGGGERLAGRHVLPWNPFSILKVI